MKEGIDVYIPHQTPSLHPPVFLSSFSLNETDLNHRGRFLHRRVTLVSSDRRRDLLGDLSS